jgi:hypothetical protein
MVVGNVVASNLMTTSQQPVQSFYLAEVIRILILIRIIVEISEFGQELTWFYSNRLVQTVFLYGERHVLVHCLIGMQPFDLIQLLNCLYIVVRWDIEPW